MRGEREKKQEMKLSGFLKNNSEAAPNTLTPRS
jgi:hypothetical protein